jgi:hypothetical protein
MTWLGLRRASSLLKPLMEPGETLEDFDVVRLPWLDRGTFVISDRAIYVMDERLATAPIRMPYSELAKIEITPDPLYGCSATISSRAGNDLVVYVVGRPPVGVGYSTATPRGRS